MLMYVFQPCAPIYVNIHCDELHNTQNILRDKQDLLHIARDKIKMAQDRACFYVDQHRRPLGFLPRKKMFLCVPHDSMPLPMGKCSKLAPHFCEPFIVLKCTGSSAYHLGLPSVIKAIFHINCLK